MINNPPHPRLPLSSASFPPFFPFTSLNYPHNACPPWSHWDFFEGGVFSLPRTSGTQSSTTSTPTLSWCLWVISLQETMPSAPSNRLSKPRCLLTLPLVLPPPAVVHAQPLPEADAGEVPKQQPPKQRRRVEKQWSHQDLGQAHAPGNACGLGDIPFCT